MPDPAEVCEVVITAPDEEWLVAFTRQLIERRLAAAGHHQTVRSVYTWDGTVHDKPESRVALHTRTSLVGAIINATIERHPYEVPCVICLPITEANSAYVQWILDATEPAAVDSSS